MGDETAHPHRYVRRRDPVLGEWCAMCGRNSWDELHAPEPATEHPRPETEAP